MVPVRSRQLHELRRRVLRGGDPHSVVLDDRDEESTSLHFGGFVGERLVACASFFSDPSPVHPELQAYQLRFMAVDADVQGSGYGARVLAVGEAALRSREAGEVWAYARDSALGFYRAVGWRLVAGSEHLSHETQLPHTVIFKPL